jgi:hypothetical protein
MVISDSTGPKGKREHKGSTKRRKEKNSIGCFCVTSKTRKTTTQYASMQTVEPKFNC